MVKLNTFEEIVLMAEGGRIVGIHMPLKNIDVKLSQTFSVLHCKFVLASQTALIHLQATTPIIKQILRWCASNDFPAIVFICTVLPLVMLITIMQ